MQGVVITARIGSPNFRPRAPKVVNPKWRYLFFTDKARANTPPWQYILVRKEQLDCCRDAKRFKILSHIYAGGDYHLWIDSHCVLRCDPARFVHSDPLTLVRHWCRRQCIRAESQRIIARGKASSSEVAAEIERYADHPDGWGLWFGGCIGFRNTDETRVFRERWYKLCAEGCRRDQLSLPVALRETGIAYHDIPCSDRGNLFEITRNA